MVSDKQVRRLFKTMNKDKTLQQIADKANMHEQTAKKYIEAGKLPSELKKPHYWQTRKDPFEEDWETKIKPLLGLNEGLEAKTIFEYLQREFPGKYQDGQLRTLQRRLKTWRATEGPDVEVMFPQIHYPGILAQSDYTNMNDLGITIAAAPFPHLLYHFVLTYSNWETGTVCFSESFESLSLGLQNALWALGGVPQKHQTDILTAAVQKTSHPDEFTRAYTDLLKHYNLIGRKTQAASPNQNGSVEQRNYRFKTALDQRLMLRGSRDFESRKEYEKFLKNLFKELNSGRLEKLAEELPVLKELPEGRLESCKDFTVRVTQNATISVQHNIYSVPSRLIKEKVKVYVYIDYMEVWYSQKCIETIPRLRGEGKHRIRYEHVISSLIKKNGAFENYKYREDMFPTINFRITYDQLLKQHTGKKAVKEYLQILYLAAKEGEHRVEYALQSTLETGAMISCTDIKDILKFQKDDHEQQKTNVNINPADLKSYDNLLSGRGGES